MRQYHVRSQRADSDTQSLTGSSYLPEPVTSRHGCMSAARKRYKYLRRLFKFQQMDFQFAFWQMWYLIFSPQKVYRNFYYRKYTKKQFARDDPAFLLLLSGWVLLSALLSAFVIGLSHVRDIVAYVVYVVGFECIGLGIIVATISWYFGNKYFRRDKNDPQDIEWGYAFDVHLNAFFPQFVILHIWQLIFFNNFIDFRTIGSRILGNSFWFTANCYYIYITFLGFNCLPFLHKTNLILSSIPFLGMWYLVLTICGWNISHFYINVLEDMLFTMNEK